VAGLAVLVSVAGCGDGADEAEPSPTETTTAAPATGSSTTADPDGLSALDLAPDLGDLGFNQTNPERIPNTGELDLAFRVFEKPSAPKLQARTEVRVYPEESIAERDFPLQAEGWKNPPPGLFGGDPENVEGPALEGPDDAVGYIAANKDPQGFRLWTDVFRIGRVIVVAHVLGQNATDVEPIRQAIADEVGAKLR
jgi:hypothetical protein